MGESESQKEDIYEMVLEGKVDERNIPKFVLLIIIANRKE